MDNEKEIPFGAFDSELMHQEITIPEGFEATIDGDKIILTRIENEDERIRKSLIILLQHFCKGYRVPGLDFPVSYKDMLDWLEKQGEQKSAAWSEEDENGLGDAIWCCKQAASIAKDENDMGNVWYAEHWLKSIKDRVQPKNHWKPSDGQMSALKIATHCPDLGLSRVLKTLYNDLDKLTKE